MAKTLFPEEMLSSGAMTLESIAGKLTYFHEQFHLLHWQTSSIAEHEAVGDIYGYIQDFKDDVIEKLMGYMHKKPGVYKIPPIAQTTSTIVAEELCQFAYKLYEWAGENDYCDVENMAQELSGRGAKLKYLLTLS